jgi:hypothetical protein
MAWHNQRLQKEKEMKWEDTFAVVLKGIVLIVGFSIMVAYISHYANMSDQDRYNMTVEYEQNHPMNNDVWEKEHPNE